MKKLFRFAVGSSKRSAYFVVLGVLGLLTQSLETMAAGTTLSVSDFGAIGDAVPIWVNTISNSPVVTTTNQLSPSDVGKAILLFGVGPYTSQTNNQDLVATISNISAGTNVTLSRTPSASANGAFCLYGTHDAPAFQNCINACTNVDTTVVIPSGKYLLIPPIQMPGFVSQQGVYPTGAYPGAAAAIIIQRGGIHFVGAGISNTVLIGCGAWTIDQAGNAMRGSMLSFQAPATNDFPVVIEGLTLDGGLSNGNTTVHGFPASKIDGSGWDETHDAILVAGSGNSSTHQMWTNVMFAHWRGEMVKSINQSTNGNLNIVNCAFEDGNATAINIYHSLNISNCVFDNLFQIAEYYQAYSTNISYFQNNFVTNITGNAFAINGGKGNNPPFVIYSNSFYLTTPGRNVIMTVPGDNIYVISNLFVCGNFKILFNLGAAGYQGTYDNSNIVIAANTIINPSILLQLSGGTNSADLHRVESVTVYSNILKQPNNAVTLVQTYGWASNIHIFGNDCKDFIGKSTSCNSGNYGSPFVLIDTNNTYFTQLFDSVGKTNYISYANGSQFDVVHPFFRGTVYALVDTNAIQIPLGAQIFLKNDNLSAVPILVYLDSAVSRGPITIGGGDFASFAWVNGAWEVVVPRPAAPANLRIIGP